MGERCSPNLWVVFFVALWGA